jgi:hypothetical protein
MSVRQARRVLACPSLPYGKEKPKLVAGSQDAHSGLSDTSTALILHSISGRLCCELVWRLAGLSGMLSQQQQGKKEVPNRAAGFGEDSEAREHYTHFLS